MVNGYIRNGGRGEGRGASLSLSGGWEDHGGGGRGRNYDNGGINIRRKILLRGGMRGGGIRGYSDSPTSLRYLFNSVIFVNRG